MASSPPSSSPLRSRLRAAAMTLGAGVLLWKTGAPWAVGLAVIASALLLLALFFPRAYGPFDHGFHQLESGTVRLISWIILALVFAIIFVPGRYLARHKTRFPLFRKDSTNTYWKPVKAASTTSFERQF